MRQLLRALLLVALAAASAHGAGFGPVPSGPQWKVAGVKKNVSTVNVASGGTFSSGTLTVTAGGATVTGNPTATVAGHGSAATASAASMSFPSGSLAGKVLTTQTITFPVKGSSDIVVALDGSGGGPNVGTTQTTGELLATFFVGVGTGAPGLVFSAGANAHSITITQTATGAFTTATSSTSTYITCGANAGGAAAVPGGVVITTDNGGAATINGAQASANGLADATITSIGTTPTIIQTYTLAPSEALACDGWVFSTAKLSTTTYSAGFRIFGLWSRNNSGSASLDGDAAGWWLNQSSVPVTPVAPSWSGNAYGGSEVVTFVPTATGVDIKGTGTNSTHYRWVLSPGACAVIPTANF